VIVDSYLATARIAARLLRSPGVTHHWSASSALPEYRISGLAGHLASATVFRVAESLDAAVPDDEPLDAVTYFTRLAQPGPALDDPGQRTIRGIGERAAGVGPEDLADRMDAALADLATRLPAMAPDHLVFATRAVLRLDQWLLSRLIELAVHIDDVAVSIDVETPTLPPEAADLVLTTLVRMAAVHYGEVPVLRSLSRRERAAVTMSCDDRCEEAGAMRALAGNCERWAGLLGVPMSVRHH